MTEPRYPYLHVRVPAEAVELVSMELWDLGASGIEERDAATLTRGEEGGITLVASFPDEESAQDAQVSLGESYPSHVEFVVGDEWRDGWKRFFKPVRLGERLVVRPSWESIETKPSDVVLTLDPGRAFGSGTHETTRLVLRELDRRVKGGESVLDVGTGSGILSIAALLLGAAHAHAIDVDADAIATTRENAELNGVLGRVVASTDPISAVEGSFPLVLANIQADVLIAMAGDLEARVADGGALVLSGILAGQDDEVRAAFPRLEEVGRERDGEWVAIVLTRGDATA